MWTAADRERYGRDGLRYPSDLTDAEWALVAPLTRPCASAERRVRRAQEATNSGRRSAKVRRGRAVLRQWKRRTHGPR